MVKKLLTYILCAATLGVNAAPIDTMNGIFDDNFKTLLVEVEGRPLAYPIISLNSDDRLIISFDELAEDNSFLRYRLIHCNANWQPSGLVESEYLEGFNEAAVNDWDYSRTTTVHYIHYVIELPNPDMNFLVSGNYLLQVYNEDDPDIVLLQARFMVSEDIAVVKPDVLSATDIDYNRSHQQVSIVVDATNAHVDDMYNGLMVYVSQNGRLDNEVMMRQPLRVSGNTAYYEHQRPLIFDGGNEYRRFETSSVTYPGRNVVGFEYHYPYYHATLLPDEPRSDSSYAFDITQHGRFVVREYNSGRSDVEADYILTHFSLKMPELKNSYIFIDSDFTNRRFDPNSMMVYNRATEQYEKSLLMKQGAYNYQYLVVGPTDRAGSTAPIEGNHYQTVNEYLVKVYYRPRGERYDHLIGTSSILFR